MNENGKPTVPVIVDSIKYNDTFPFTRCTYYSIACDTPSPNWTLVLENHRIPFFLLGISGIIWKPLGEETLFNKPEVIDDLFDLIETTPECYVDIDDLWLPNLLFHEQARRCDVYRLHHLLFSEAYRYRQGRITKSDFVKYCQDVRSFAFYSEEETMSFRRWEERLIIQAKEKYPKDKALELKWLET